MRNDNYQMMSTRVKLFTRCVLAIFFSVVRIALFSKWVPFDAACIPFASVAGSRGAIRVRDQLAGGGNPEHHPGQDAAVDREEDH